MLTFAQVKFSKMDGTSVIGTTRLCHRFWGYAVKLQPNATLSDGRRGDVYFNMQTRRPQGYAIGPVVVMDTHQEKAGLDGNNALADCVPQQGSILFGMDRRNDRPKQTPFCMTWWNANGGVMFHFVQAITGAARAGLVAWRRKMKQQHGMQDGLFAIFLLVVVGDVDTFVRQHMGTIQGDPLCLSCDDDVTPTSPLTFAVQVARAFGDAELEQAVVEAAQQAGVTDWDVPPQEAPTGEVLVAHADWEEPCAMAANPSRRASGTLATILQEYGDVVVNTEPVSVFHGGFVQYLYQDAQAVDAEASAVAGTTNATIEKKNEYGTTTRNWYGSGDYEREHHTTMGMGFSGDYKGPPPRDSYQHPRVYTEEPRSYNPGAALSTHPTHAQAYDPSNPGPMYQQRHKPTVAVPPSEEAVRLALGMRPATPPLTRMFATEAAVEGGDSGGPASPGNVPASPGYVPASPGYVPASPGNVPASPGYVPASPGYVPPPPPPPSPQTPPSPPPPPS